MDKKSEFKNFLNKHPEILRFIKNKEMTFQDFYEIYDIYGEENDVWNKYFKEDSDTSSTRDKISELTSIFKNINMDNIEHHVNNAQKAISGELLACFFLIRTIEKMRINAFYR